MSEEFDPYRKWLGIAPHEQPPHHYRLLGIAPFEDDLDVIQNAADRQMAHVRTFQSGKFRNQSQKLLNELSQANIILHDPAKKAAYDAELHDLLFAPPLAETEQQPEPELPPVAAPPAANLRGIPMGQAIPVAAAAPLVSVGGKSRASASRARARKKSSFLPIVLGLIGVGALLVGMLVFIVSQTNDELPEKGASGNKAITQNDKPASPPPAAKKTNKTNKKEDRPEQVATTKLPPPVDTANLPADQQFKLALMQARDSLSKRDAEQRDTAIAQAESLQQSEADEAEVKHLRTLAAYLNDFWKAVHVGVTERMQAGDVVEYEGETVELIQRDGQSAKVKYNNDDEEISTKITELPAPIAALLARKGLNMKEARSLLSVATFWAFDAQSARRTKAQERAKALWVEAAERGIKDAALARELGLDEKFVASIVPKVEDRKPLVEKPTMPKPESDPETTDTTPATITKQPVPSADQLREAKQAFMAKYGDDLARARKVQTEHEAFMTKLEAEAAKEKDNALQYVMYSEACDAAASVLRHDALMKLVDEMDQRWEIDALRMKQLLLLQTRPLNSPATENFADTAAELAKTAHEAGRLDVAIAAANYSLRVGDKVKGRDQKELLRKVREWEAYGDAAAKAKLAEEALAKDAEDGSAHLQLGRFQCYFERNWPMGLVHLSKCDSEDEKTAATEDLANPTDAVAQHALAERWYMLAKRKSGTARLAVLERAKQWYESALPTLDEATRAATETRLREIEKDLAPLAGP